MKTHKLIFLCIVLLLITAACQATDNAQQATDTSTAIVQIFPTDTALPAPTEAKPTEIPPTATAAPSALTAAMVSNMSYNLPEAKQTVTLKDGKYESGQGTNYILATLSDVMVFGDLNGDGQKDAAVILAENMGGSGIFESLVVIYNQGGQPVQGPSIPIGDRVQVKSMKADGAHITLNIVVPGPNDPMCCPSQLQKQTYTVTPHGITLSHLSSTTPNNLDRSIQIKSPKGGEQVVVQMEVSGSVTIAPFENTLAYKVLGPSGIELASGSFTVSAAGAGGPATFDTKIDLSKVASGSGFWLQIMDVSAADGSIIALDAVELTRK